MTCLCECIWSSRCFIQICLVYVINERFLHIQIFFPYKLTLLITFQLDNTRQSSLIWMCKHLFSISTDRSKCVFISLLKRNLMPFGFSAVCSFNFYRITSGWRINSEDSIWLDICSADDLLLYNIKNVNHVELTVWVLDGRKNVACWQISIL